MTLHPPQKPPVYTLTIQAANPMTPAIKPSIQFNCTSEQTILEAAFAAGFILPYGCKNGACGTCQTPLNQGSVRHIQNNNTVDAAIAQGAILPCCACPTSDVALTARLTQADTDYPVKKLPIRIASIVAASTDVAIVTLQLPAAEKLAFRAGQYLEFILRDGTRRAYSMGNAPHTLASNNNQLELHIRHLPGGVFTDALFGLAQADAVLKTVKEKDIMRIEVPQGTFYWRDAPSDSPNQAMIMVASGTGFAPIKALIEHSFTINNTRPIILYWGGRQLADLYLHELAQSWTKAYSHIQYIPVLSEASEHTNWQGRTGFVHQAVMTDYPNMADYQVYACGAPIVVQSAQRDFVRQCQLPATAFFADSFTSTADKT